MRGKGGLIIAICVVGVLIALLSVAITSNAKIATILASMFFGAIILEFYQMLRLAKRSADKEKVKKRSKSNSDGGPAIGGW